MIIDNNLNWSAPIRYIQNKIAKGIEIIIKTRKVFDYETLLSLYNSLIYPYITYCIYAWGNAFPTHIKPIVLSQKKAVRIITGVLPRSPIKILFKESDILKISLQIFNGYIHVQILGASSVSYPHLEIFWEPHKPHVSYGTHKVKGQR